MIVGDRIGPLSTMADYIRSAYKVVEERAGVTFGKPFIQQLNGEANVLFSSLPPSRALNAFKAYRPHDALLMAHEIQKAIYFYGKAPGDESVYLDLAKKFDLPVNTYREKLWSDENISRTEKDFQQSKELQVSGFPTVFMSNGEEYLLMGQGFMEYEDLLMNAINSAAYYGVDLMS